MSIAITTLVSQILRDYDHDRDGVIALTRPQPTGNCLQRFVSTLTTPDERISAEVTIGNPSIIPSAIRLFREADVNHDQRVTREEMVAVMARFDDNHDGILESRGWAIWKPCDEYERYDKAFGEDQTDPDTYVP